MHTANTEWDCIIIGSGMSGLAAGIRLAHFGKKVIILEQHNAAGGLNGFYSIAGRKYDVGLHAVTNYVNSNQKQAPLNKLLRQLRISRDEWDLNEQINSKSLIKTHNTCIELNFNNDFSLLESEVYKNFPHQIDAFKDFLACIHDTQMGSLTGHFVSTKDVIQRYIKDPLLIDLLLLPLYYYGSAHENDMDWAQAVVMFQSIFKEGFARPYEGVRVIIRSLLEKYRSLGGIRRMKALVKKIIIKNKKAVGIELENGEILTSKKILSSAGYIETLNLCNHYQPTEHLEKIGNLSFVETLSTLDIPPKTLGINDTIVFFNTSCSLAYQKPKELVDSTSGVICIPNNYNYGNQRVLTEGCLRITALANYDKWAGLPQEDYLEQKKYYFDQLQKKMAYVLAPHEDILFEQKLLSNLEKHTIATDMFTPRTVKKYTRHLNGAIYGSTHKLKDGKTEFTDLYICGTDQGFLGIIGSMMSGVIIANGVLV